MEEKIKRLAELKKLARMVEEENQELYAEINAIEKEIKQHVVATGETFEGYGLRVATVPGRTTYEGAALYEAVQTVADFLQSVHGKILEGEAVEAAQILDSCLAFCVKILAECKKEGAIYATIRELKGR